MLNCSKANKIQCRPDLFGCLVLGVWFCSRFITPRLLHPLCLLSLPISSNAWLGCDSLLDYFISPSVIFSRAMAPFFNCCWCKRPGSRVPQAAYAQIPPPLASVCTTCVVSLIDSHTQHCISDVCNRLSSKACAASSCREFLRSLTCFGKMDGDSFGFIIMLDLFIAWLHGACWLSVAL